MRISLLRAAATAMICCMVGPLLSQESTALSDTTLTWRIQTSDKNEYLGKIREYNTEEILLVTDRIGPITIRRADIVTLEPIRTGRVVDGEYWFEPPLTTRYFWNPNAYGLRPGEGYYQNVWLIFSQFNIGITENTSIGIGTIPLFLLGATSSPVWLTPKISIPTVKERLNIGVGMLAGTVLGGGDNTGFGLAYSMLTIGSRDNNISAGLGYGYGGGEFARTPTITLSGMLRTGRRQYFMTENYWIQAGSMSLLLLSVGGRHVGKSVSWDFGGAFRVYGSDFATFGVLPWLSISVPFGKRGSHIHYLDTSRKLSIRSK